MNLGSSDKPTRDTERGYPQRRRGKKWRAGARGKARRPGSGAQAREREAGAARGTLGPEESQVALLVVLDVAEPGAVSAWS